MNKVTLVEDLVTALLSNKSDDFIRLVEVEIKKAKSKGHHNVARRLQNLIKDIPSKDSFFGQGSITKTISPRTISSPLYERIESDVLLDEVILSEPNKAIVSDFLSEWQDYDKLAEHGEYPSNRLLLYGPPGTGKTKLAFAIANKLDYSLIFVRLDELVSSLLGKTGKNIREIFDIAREERVVIFLDEIDTVAKHRDDSGELGELKRVVTVLLQNIDMFPHSSIIIGATNHDSLLDEAVWRRFDIKIGFDLPAEDERRNLFKLYLSSVCPKIDFSVLSKLAKGMTGSTIFDVCRNIKRQAIILGQKDKFTTLDAVESMIFFVNRKSGNIKMGKKEIYAACQKLSDSGVPLADIATKTGVAYTTLRDNVK